MTYQEFDLWLIEQARLLPCPMNKESDAQKAARQSQIDTNNMLLATYKQSFAQEQAILGILTPQLEEMAKSPEGFGATEYAALQAKIINDVGGQYSNVAKEAAREFATTNEAGLPSGVEAQVQAIIAAGAAGQVATGTTNLAIANEQLKQQQRDFALSSLAGQTSLLAGQSGTAGGQVLSGVGAQFNQATQVYNQGSLWKNILSGVVGAGLDVATGGLSGLATAGIGALGRSFGGGNQVPFGADPGYIPPGAITGTPPIVPSFGTSVVG
jgi:hypothetical protein